MIWSALLRRLTGRQPPTSGLVRRRIDPTGPFYAVGDVHGHLDALLALEALIVADAREQGGQPTLVYLGDLIDRGPQSAGVLDCLMARDESVTRLALGGNHEALMLEFLARPRREHEWLEFGGRETLLSYGISDDDLRRAEAVPRRLEQIVRAHVPDEHVRFLAGLPHLIEAPGHLLVHAGLRPGVGLEQQSAGDLLWYRDDFEADYAGLGARVVHGHTPGPAVRMKPFRLNLDTGAYRGGPLSAARLSAHADPFILAVAQGSRGGAWTPWSGPTSTS
jgi:serine/threonine protein phosphatase 1